MIRVCKNGRNRCIGSCRPLRTQRLIYSIRMLTDIGLLSDAEPLDLCTILLDVVLLDVIEKASALTDHLLKAAA